MKQLIQKYERPGKWEVKVPFEKQGEKKEWKGIIDARASGEYELSVVARHEVMGTTGRVVIRAVVGKGARVKIRGRIVIVKEANETEDFLEIRALMLDPEARVILDPELEIEANNVRASHAASSGVIDQEQLEYLQSKGLTREEAKVEIIQGWLEE